MKLRIILLTGLLVLGLAACSLAEDVTPPANYVAPTVALTNTPIPPTATIKAPTSTSPSTETPLAATQPAVSETTSAGGTPESQATGEATQAALDTTGTPGVQVGTVSGTVISGSGGSIPADLAVILRGFDMPADNSSNPTESVHLPGTVQSDGSFSFENVEVPAGRIFLAEVTYNGIAFQSDYVVADQPLVSLPALTIYESTDDYTTLNVEQVHIALDYSTENVVQVVEMYIMTNTTQKAISVATDGTSIPFVSIPADATNLSFQVASGSATFIGTDTGFALVPLPAEQKYGLVAVFDLPYQKKLNVDLPFVLPAASVTIFAPEGVKVASDAFTDQGLQDFSGTSYQVYEATDVKANSTLAMKLTGQPAAADGSTGTPAASSTQQWLIIGLGTGGMALIGVGLFLFIRDRKRKAEEELEDESDLDSDEEDTPEKDQVASKDDRDAILDAIIALDEQFKAGEISKSVYEKRRAELKTQLKSMVD